MADKKKSKVEKAGKTEREFMPACDKWRSIVKQQSVKVDDSDLTEGEVQGVTQSRDDVTDF